MSWAAGCPCLDEAIKHHFVIWRAAGSFGHGTGLLRPCPGHTGNYTPVPGRRVGRTQMEESKTLGNRYSNFYGETQEYTME